MFNRLLRTFNLKSIRLYILLDISLTFSFASLTKEESLRITQGSQVGHDCILKVRLVKIGRGEEGIILNQLSYLYYL